jgi:WD40 repeat protein
VRLFDAATGKRLDAAPAHDGDVLWVRFAPDGDTVYTFSKTEVRAWAAKGGAPKGPPVVRPAAERGAWGTETPLAFTTRTADGKGFELTGWDAPAGKVAWRVALPRETWRVLSHDGARVTALVWDANANEWGMTEIDGPKGRIGPALRLPGADRAANDGRDLALSGDGKLLFVADGNEVAALDSRTGEEVRRFETGPAAGVDVIRYIPSGIAVSHDGSRLAILHRVRREMAVRTFDTKTGRVLAEHGLPFNVNRTAVAVWDTAGRRVLLLDGTDGKAKPRELGANGSAPKCAAFAPNEALLAVGYEDGTALIWDVTAKPKE